MNSPLINKDAALDKQVESILSNHIVGHETGSRVFFTLDQAKQQIIDLINREVVAARIDEVKKVWGHAREHTLTDIEMIMHRSGGKVDFIEAVDTQYLEIRLAELNQRKSEDE
jgi:hypothetical protein